MTLVLVLYVVLQAGLFELDLRGCERAQPSTMGAIEASCGTPTLPDVPTLVITL